MAAFQRKTFDPSKLLRVHFVGESAVDTGGPRQEFLQLMIGALFTDAGLLLQEKCLQRVSFRYNVSRLKIHNVYICIVKWSCCKIWVVGNIAWNVTII